MRPVGRIFSINDRIIIMEKKDALITQQLGFLKPYLKRDDLVEICINREHEVCLETVKGKWEYKTDKKVTLENIRLLTSTMASLSGQEFDGLEYGSFSGQIPHYGHRVQVNMGSQVASEVCVSIRVGKADIYPINSYMPDDEADRLIKMVQKGKTILISAGTGAGKTTFLNSLIAHIPDDLRIITLEDTIELNVPHRNNVRLTKSKTDTGIANLDYQHFINSIMRLRPDRILLGEIDTKNTMSFLNLANSGHSGSISTIHSDSDEGEEGTFNRICLNAAQSGANGTKSDNMEYARAAIDVVVSLKKEIIDGKRKFSAKIAYEKPCAH